MRLHDVTLRDGNHALRHQLTVEQAKEYATSASKAGIKSIEIGHGNGLGASSFLVGKSNKSDSDLIRALTDVPGFEFYGTHAMPSFATMEDDLKPALDLGINYFRLGAHVTETDTLFQHISFLKGSGARVAACLMMISHANLELILDRSKKLAEHGVDEIVFMDSVGRLTPQDVHGLIKSAGSLINVEVGFHAHDNLGLAVANSVSALQAGATILDVSSLGMGAGAGNAALEKVVTVMSAMDMFSGVEPERAFELADHAEKIGFRYPASDTLSLATSYSNLFSGFKSVILEASQEFNVNPVTLAIRCRGHKLVAGQEDSVAVIAEELSLEEGVE